MSDTVTVRFIVQRYNKRYDAWLDGTGHHQDGVGDYPFKFRTFEEAERAVKAARRRAASWGTPTKFRVIREERRKRVIDV